MSEREFHIVKGIENFKGSVKKCRCENALTKMFQRVFVRETFIILKKIGDLGNMIIIFYKNL